MCVCVFCCIPTSDRYTYIASVVAVGLWYITVVWCGGLRGLGCCKGKVRIEIQSWKDIYYYKYVRVLVESIDPQYLNSYSNHMDRAERYDLKSRLWLIPFFFPPKKKREIRRRSKTCFKPFFLMNQSIFIEKV